MHTWHTLNSPQHSSHSPPHTHTLNSPQHSSHSPPTHPHLELPSAQLTLAPHTPTPHSPTISVRVGGLALTSTEGRDLLSAGEKLSGLVGLAGGERLKLLQEGEIMDKSKSLRGANGEVNFLLDVQIAEVHLLLLSPSWHQRHALHIKPVQQG